MNEQRRLPHNLNSAGNRINRQVIKPTAKGDQMIKGLTLAVILSFCLLISTPIAEAAEFVFSKYGWKKYVNVTSFVYSRCALQTSCTFKVGNELFGDPAPGEDKFLFVYASNGACRKIPEGATVTFYEVKGRLECKADGQNCNTHCSWE